MKPCMMDDQKKTAVLNYAIDVEHKTRLQQLCEDLRLQQQALKQKEEELAAQKERTERLESSMENDKICHEEAMRNILEDHDRKIAAINKKHSFEVSLKTLHISSLQKKIAQCRLMSEIHEMEDHYRKMNEKSNLNNESLLHKGYKRLLDVTFLQRKDMLAFKEELTSRKEEMEKLQVDKNAMQIQLTETNAKLESREKEVKTLNKQLRDYEQKMKENNTSLTKDLKITLDKYEDMKGKSENKQKENKSCAEYMRQKEQESRALKRKLAVKQFMEEVSSESPPKQIRTGSVYQRPGPPTPGKQPRRISGRFTQSHSISPMPGGRVKVLGSPIGSPRHSSTSSRPTPRRSPRINSQIYPASNTIIEKSQGSVTVNGLSHQRRVVAVTGKLLLPGQMKEGQI